MTSPRFEVPVDEQAPVYVISVAAQLSGMHPQTLRQYDRLGLVQPSRTSGRGRRYSVRDVAVLRYIQHLSQNEGVNLAGIQRILELESELGQLRSQVTEMMTNLQQSGTLFPRNPRVFSAGPAGVQTMSRGQRMRWGRAPLELLSRRAR